MAGRWVVVAAVVLVALGGCGDEPEDEPAIVPVPVTSGASPVPSGSPVVAAATRTGGTGAAAAPTAAGPTGTGPERPAGAGAERPTGAGLAGFVAVVQREMPELIMDRRDEEIATLAQQACDSLAAGRSAGAVVDEVRTYGTDRAAARELVKLAITTACPAQHRRTTEF
jgi:hypothetical protein